MKMLSGNVSDELDAANLQGRRSQDIVCQSGDIVSSKRIFFSLGRRFKTNGKMNSMAEEIAFFQVFASFCAFPVCIC